MDVRSSFQRMKEAPGLSFLRQLTDAQVLWTGAHAVAALGTVLEKGRGPWGKVVGGSREPESQSSWGERLWASGGAVSGLFLPPVLWGPKVELPCSPISHPVPPW